MVHAELLIDDFFVGGPCDQSVGKAVIRAPYDGALVGTAAEGGLSELRASVDAAHNAFPAWRDTPRHERQALLRRVAALVRERREEFVDLLTREVGKPVVWSRGEVERLAITFDAAADALASFGQESIPLDLDPRGKGMRGIVERFPLGVIFCIVPYNWPFNLTAHKLAPALATGNTVVVKPSPLAPITTLALVRLIHEAGCPPGVINAWNGHPSLAQRVLVEDKRIRMLSFTGSAAVGWKLKELLPTRKVALELGGNASVILDVHGHAELAISRIVSGAFGYAGQVCIAVQHALFPSYRYDETREGLIAAVQECPYGDPSLESTVCGPMISIEAADKVWSMVEEAVAGGAKVLVGGRGEGTMMPPTLVENVPDDCRLANEEVFGPVLTVESYDFFEDAIARVNRSKYGIHAGVFTEDADNAELAFRRLEVGGVVINDFPTLRFDALPYGGVKQSGFGREGVRYAMEEMTETKTLVVKHW